MIKNEHIIWFGGSDWWAHHKRNEQYTCEYFAKQNTVLYVNSIGIGLPRPATADVMKRIARKIRSLMRWFVKTETGVYVVSPFFIPLWSSPLVKSINRRLLLAQLRRMMKKAGIQNPVVVSSIPTTNEFLHQLPHATHIYNLFDNFAAYHEQQMFMSVKENDYALRDSADVVVCTSKGLFDQLSAKRKHVFWIPHGVHPAFLYPPETMQEPEEIKDIPHPRLSYWGQLDAKVDYALLHDIALRRPDWHIILYGTKSFTYPAIESLPNVHLFGYAPPSFLNQVGHYSDILLMPWTVSEWIRYSCPIKYREYLAVGKPVVSSSIIEVETAYPGEAHIAGNADEWIAAIEECLRTDPPERQAHRRALVTGYDNNAADAAFNDAIAYALAHAKEEQPT